MPPTIAATAWSASPLRCKQVAQLLLMCDGHDIGISIDSGDGSWVRRARSNHRRYFVYDNYPGGIGFSAPLFHMHDELLTKTRRADR